MPVTTQIKRRQPTLKEFLIKEGIYAKYLANCASGVFNPSLASAFIWQTSTEGYDYWANAYAKWEGSIEELISYPVPTNEKERTPFAKYIYDLSISLGHDGFTLLQSESYTTILNPMVAFKDYITKELEAYSDYEQACVGNLPVGWNKLTRIILKDIRLKDVQYNLRYVAPFLKLIGTNAQLNFEEGTIQLGKEDPKQLTVKAFGRKFGFVKWSSWPKIAERIKHELTVASRIKYFTDYESLREYYINSDCSGESCMRKDFSDLPLHPCAVYAHDIMDYANYNGISNIHNYVSEGIKLAVLFDEAGVPEARCMVNSDAKVRGKAFGLGASTLTKVLGYYEGMEGNINIIETVDNTFLMPYVDGVDVVDGDNGKLGEGSLGCDSTGGISSEGLWSDYEDRYIEEEYAVFSAHLNSHITEEDATRTVEDDWLPDDHDDLWLSNTGDYFIDGNSDYLYLECIEEWVEEDDAEEVLLEYISGNATISELIEFTETL